MPAVRPERWDAVALALAGGATVAEAARAGTLTERAVYAKQQGDPAFRARVEEFRNRAVGEALGKLSAGLTRAADALLELVGSADERVKLSAARAVLELMLKVKDQAATDERLRKVEAELYALNGDPAGGGGTAVGPAATDGRGPGTTLPR